MPTYAVSTAADLSLEQRAIISKCLTEIHHVEARAPKSFVQVVFYRLEHGSHFIAGEPADPGQIWVRADIRAGRTEEQRTRILNRIVAEVAEIAVVPREHVWVYLSELPHQNMSELGHPLPQPGDEEAWLAKLRAKG